MRRRLVIVIAGAVAAAVTIVGLGTLVLSAADSRRRVEADLARQVGELAAILAEVPPVRLAPLAGRLEGALDVSQAAAVPIEAAAALFGPDDAARLRAGQTVSARDGEVARAAAPLPATGGTEPRRALLLAAPVGSGVGTAGRWFVVAGIGTILLGTLIAWRLAATIAQPLARAEAATRRIAAGDLEVRVPEPTTSRPGDELASLAGAVNHMAASLQRSRSMERDFLLSVSHDLRTPLTSISGWAEALADGAAPDTARAGTTIGAEAHRLDRLVGDLLDLARLRASSFTMELSTVDLAAVIAGTADGLRPEVEAEGLSLVVDAPSAPAMVLGDADRVAQIAANLIDNARRYAATTVAVRVGTDPQPRIEVADDGSGIPLEERSVIGHRVAGASRPAARSGSGSGVGLAIVAELASAMDAELSVSDSPEGGARFVVSFPTLVPL